MPGFKYGINSGISSRFTKGEGLRFRYFPGLRLRVFWVRNGLGYG